MLDLCPSPPIRPCWFCGSDLGPAEKLFGPEAWTYHGALHARRRLAVELPERMQRIREAIAPHPQVAAPVAAELDELEALMASAPTLLAVP